jgi:putative ABC transport system substrate-binding protein
MRRREFIAGLGSAAAWPVVVRAQQTATPVIGFLHPETPDLAEYLVRAFRQGLNETGYVEGRNVAIDYRWAQSQNDRLAALAADLVRRKVTVIVTSSILAAQAAKAATTTIPIVFYTGATPAVDGLVASLNRPGGNLTGVTGLNGELGPKRLELLHELLPAASTIPILVDPNGRSAGALSSDMQAAARALGIQLQVLHAGTERDFDTIFATLAPGTGLLINASLFLTSGANSSLP